MQLRGYQSDLKAGIYERWNNGLINILGVMPTGGGKSATLAAIVAEMMQTTAVIAHRQELLTQLSSALARFDVYHNIVAPLPVIKLINRLHVEEFGKSFYRESGRVSVVGVDTLMSRKAALSHWAKSVGFWIQDEAHHVLRKNKWGSAVELFPNAKYGLGVTATPVRADGYGLGKNADGVFDDMVIGPDLRWLIHEGYLTDYVIYAPPTDMDFSHEKVGESGDYNHKQLRKIAKESQIVGDVVKHYLRLARGKLGITFAPDIETATEIATNFNNNGIPAAVLHSGTPDDERISIMRRFRNRDLLQIVNVDILGEGVDVPAVEVVSFARKTESFGLFVQQCGRVLRPIFADGYDLSTQFGRLMAILNGIKPTAIIIDHVGNVTAHATARDCPYSKKLVINLCHRDWSLKGRNKRNSKADDDDIIPLRTCTNTDCFGDYPRVLKACPYCGHVPVPASREGPEFVDGDLTELSPSAFAGLTRSIVEVDKDINQYRQDLFMKRVPDIAIPRLLNNRVQAQVAQKQLRETISQWAGWQRSYSRPDSESYRRFYFKFGVDVMTAQTLGAKEALELTDKIKSQMTEK